MRRISNLLGGSEGEMRSSKGVEERKVGRKSSGRPSGKNKGRVKQEQHERLFTQASCVYLAFISTYIKNKSRTKQFAQRIMQED